MKEICRVSSKIEFNLVCFERTGWFGTGNYPECIVVLWNTSWKLFKFQHYGTVCEGSLWYGTKYTKIKSLLTESRLHPSADNLTFKLSSIHEGSTALPAPFLSHCTMDFELPIAEQWYHQLSTLKDRVINLKSRTIIWLHTWFGNVQT